MKKIFLVCFFFTMMLPQAFAHDFHILTREDWGANEAYTDIKSQFWTDILVAREAKRLQNINTVKTPEQIATSAEKAELSQKRLNYVNKNYASRYALRETQYYNEGMKLAWPVKKSQNIDGIILHHTATEYESSIEGVRNILKFHGINREWGDMGYNYIIGYNGEVYEGRLGGDYAIGAHTSWNNYSTIGIALLGNYNQREVNIRQRKSLENLLSHVIYKYDIDMMGEVPLHTLCTDCTNGITTEFFSPIAGHRDGGSTSCPGENIYKIIPALNKKFSDEQLKYDRLFQKLPEVFKTYDREKLSVLDQKIKLLATKDASERNRYILEKLGELIRSELELR